MGALKPTLRYVLACGHDLAPLESPSGLSRPGKAQGVAMTEADVEAVSQALRRGEISGSFGEALRAFEAHAGPLAPHFAYGALDKPSYARAHLMHLANHWQEALA